MPAKNMTTDNDENKSLYLIAISVIAIIAIVLVFGFYLYFFNGELPLKHETWGAFGDYIGGTLNPILSFLALIALLITIAIQSKQLYLSRKELELTKIELAKTADASQKQAEYFENEAKRSDIYRIIEKLSERINKNFNENRIDPLPNKSTYLSVHSALKKGDDINANKELNSLYTHYQNTHSDTYRTIKWLENDLERLAHYITSYEGVTEANDRGTPFPEFYRAEFGYMVLTFHKYNMVKKLIYEFYCS